MNCDLLEPEEPTLTDDAMSAAKAAFEDMEEELLRDRAFVAALAAR